MSTRHQRSSTDAVESGERTESTDDTEDGSGRGSQAEQLPLDVVFDVLRNERRRRVLRYLDDHDGVVDLGDLAEHVAAIENDVTVPELSAQQRKRVYVGLYQCHLPKMADADVVQFDKDRGLIRPGPALDQLQQYLDTEDEQDDDGPWTAVLGGSAVAGYLLAVIGGFAMQAAGGVVILAALAAFALLKGVPGRS